MSPLIICSATIELVPVLKCLIGNNVCSAKHTSSIAFFNFKPIWVLCQAVEVSMISKHCLAVVSCEVPFFSSSFKKFVHWIHTCGYLFTILRMLLLVLDSLKCFLLIRMKKAAKSTVVFYVDESCFGSEFEEDDFTHDVYFYIIFNFIVAWIVQSMKRISIEKGN